MFSFILFSSLAILAILAQDNHEILTPRTMIKTYPQEIKEIHVDTDQLYQYPLLDQMTQNEHGYALELKDLDKKADNQTDQESGNSPCQLLNTQITQTLHQTLQKSHQSKAEDFQDVLIFPEYNKAFTFSNITASRQISITQINLQYSKLNNSFYQHIENAEIYTENSSDTYKLEVDTNTHSFEPEGLIWPEVFSVQYQGIPYIFTYYGVYVFDASKDLPLDTNDKSHFKMIENVVFRHQITNVTIHDSYISVFFGNSGAKLYKITDDYQINEFLHDQNIAVEFQPGKDETLRDIRGNDHFTFVLYKKKGLQVIKHKGNKEIMFIPTVDARAFDMINNTIIIIEDDFENKRQIILEYHINYDSYMFYLNKKTIEAGTNYHEVILERNIAFLVSETSIKQITHSTYQSFLAPEIQELRESKLQFEDGISLVKSSQKTSPIQTPGRAEKITEKSVQNLENNNRYYDIIGISDSQIYIIRTNISLPILQCQSVTSLSKQYVLNANQTCQQFYIDQIKASELQFDEYFAQCQQESLLNIIILGDKDSQSKLLIIILSAVVVVMLLILVVGNVLWKKKTQNDQNQSSRSRQYEDYYDDNIPNYDSVDKDGFTVRTQKNQELSNIKTGDIQCDL